MDLMWTYLTVHLITVLVAGYGFMHIKNKTAARFVAWCLVICTTAVVSFITSSETPLFRMVIIVVLLLLTMKTVVVVEGLPANRLTWFQWTAFAVGWVGMRPALFRSLPSSPLPFRHLASKGVLGIASGMIIISLTVFFDPPVPFVADLLLLIGLSLVLHFGFLNLSAALWRLCGVNTGELFRSPLRSKSLKEFWGKRWNVAFSEMTSLVSYRPLKAIAGPDAARTLSFLLSGVLHEIAISLPVQGGYGLPTLYFAVQAIAMRFETQFPPIQRITAHPVLSRVWVMTLLLVPLPLLFHTAFIRDVLIPLRELVLPHALLRS